MNFSFGNNPTSTQASGFGFGNTATTSSGFSFGQKSNSGATTGFSFGGNPPPQPFKPSTSSTSQNTGFSFNSAPSAASQQTSSTPAFGLGSSVTTQSAKSSFGSQSATSSFGFGAPSKSSTPAIGFGFSNPSTASTNLKVGVPAAAQSGLNLGSVNAASAATSTTTGFSFGNNLAATNKPFGSLAPFNPAQNSAANVTSSAKPPSFGFASAITTNIQQSSSTSAFNFSSGSHQTQVSSSGVGLSLNQASSLTTASSSGFSLANLLTSSKSSAPVATSAISKPSFATGFQLSTGSPAASSTAFQLPGSKTAASTSAQKETSASVPVPSAGRFSLYQSAESAPTAKTQSNTQAQPFNLQTTTGISAHEINMTTGIRSMSRGHSLDRAFYNLNEESSDNKAPSNLKTSQSSGSSFAFPSNQIASIASTTSAAASNKPVAGLALSFNKPISSTATTAATAATTASAPSLKYKELEAKINKWRGELEQQEHLFITQATQVNAWNKLLIDNSEKITSLNKDFDKVSCDQERLNQELDFIKTQQDELENLLVPLEQATKKQIGSMTSSVHTHHADVERERTYNLAGTIDSQLKRMVQDLREVIDHVNASSDSGDTTNPVNQISKILSAHMDSLQWLDTNSGALQQKLDQLTKQVNERKQEQESRLRLAFD